MAAQYDFIDLQLDAAENVDTDLGDITAPIGASRITGICAELACELGYTAIGFLAIAKLSWTGCGEMDGIPVNWCQSTATGQVFYQPKFIPVNIPIVGGHTKIMCEMRTHVALTGQTQHGKVCLRFE